MPDIPYDPETIIPGRARRYAGRADVSEVVEALRSAREQIISRWLEAVATQPFHRGRSERAVSDDIPALFDAIVDSLASEAPAKAPLENPRADSAARGHARSRSTQGLLPAEVVLEIRLLRQEILHALREGVPDEADVSDVLGTELLLSDALDGAIGIAMNYFIDALEEAKEDFVAIAAHDLRTPLTVLKGTVQILQRQTRAGALKPETLLNSLSAAEAEANRMEQLLSNLLDITHVRSGRLEISPEPTDLRVAVQRVVSRLNPAAAARIAIEGEDRPIVGLWEPSRIEQVIENLANNALKYAPSGPIRIQLEQRGERAVLHVVDQGIGLTADDRAQLFHRFYRSPEALARKLEGTGLGLFICRGIIDAHGGQISVTSPGPGKGTTFIVSLPLGGLPRA